MVMLEAQEPAFCNFTMECHDAPRWKGKIQVHILPMVINPRTPPFTYSSQQFMLQVIGRCCLSLILSNLLLFSVLFLKAMTEETEMPVSPVLKMCISKVPLTDSLQVWVSWKHHKKTVSIWLEFPPLHFLKFRNFLNLSASFKVKLVCKN